MQINTGKTKVSENNDTHRMRSKQRKRLINVVIWGMCLTEDWRSDAEIKTKKAMSKEALLKRNVYFAAVWTYGLGFEKNIG